MIKLIKTLILNTNMTLIERTYQTLKQAKLTTTREAFSRDYVGMSRNWFAWQRHMKRDFSLISAITCLRCIRARQDYSLPLNRTQRMALDTAERQILEHISESYGVIIADD